MDGPLARSVRAGGICYLDEIVEALQTLGDRFAIYGFAGSTRKRCEAYPVKRFDDSYGDEVKGRICGIEPRDYTRKGKGAAFRHLSGLHPFCITIDGEGPDYLPHMYGTAS